MSDKKQYVDIDGNMTLNGWKDGVADTRENREFQILKNYIPGKGELRTREGITVFTHTPDDTVDVWTPETPDQTFPLPPGDFAVIQAVFPFNSDAKIGHNLLNDTMVYSAYTSVSRSGKCTVQTGFKVEGAASLIMTNDTVVNTDAGEPNVTYGMRTLNIFPSWMPGDSGELTKKFLITYWVYPFSAGASTNAEWHFSFGNESDVTKVALMLRHFDNDLQSHWSDSGGGTLSNLDLTGIVAENQWQFVAAWYDGDTSFEGIYHYNLATLTETYTANTNPPTPQIGFDHFYHHSAVNTINGKNIWNGVDSRHVDASDAYHGYMDYCTMWSRPMHVNNTSNITLVRAIRDMAWLL